MHTFDGDAIRIKADFEQEIWKPRQRKHQGNGPKTRKRMHATRVFNQWKPDIIGGEHNWRCVRERNLAQFRNQPGMPTYNRIGIGDGFTKQMADAVWAEAKTLAAKDMEIIKTVMEINENDMAEEALTCALEVMRGPVSAEVKLKAAKLVLDMTKAKPAQKQTVTVAAAENWLETLATKGADSD